jgi:hypothetical protein
LWDILADKPISSVNINQHIPPGKIVYMEQKKANLDKIVQKIQKKKITSENHDNPAKTNELASAESAPAHGSRASADRIYAAAEVPGSQDADGKGTTGNTFPIPVDFFASFQIARPIPKAICATAEIPANQYGMPTHQQRHSAAKEKQRESAQLLPCMPDLSRRPKTAETAENLHYVQVQPQQPCNALHARMPNLRAKGYKERNAVSGAAQMQPINFQGLQPINFLGFAPPIVDNNTAAAHGGHNYSLTRLVGGRSCCVSAGT